MRRYDPSFLLISIFASVDIVEEIEVFERAVEFHSMVGLTHDEGFSQKGLNSNGKHHVGIAII